jgi:hypothetical protein
VIDRIPKTLQAALATAVLAAASCTSDPPLPALDAVPDAFSLVAQPPADRIAAGEAKRGVGWTPNVEVDGEDRVHLAWTDADVGDVIYAVSAPGASAPESAEIVDERGAAGGFVRLAVTPGGAPVISYVHQDERSFRVAHRPADVVKMKAGGATVDEAPLDAAQAQAIGKGWVAEEIGFGDEVGTASALHVDASGRPHVVYYVKGDRLRYARRPASVPAFGAGGVGHWEKLDVDPRAGQSPTLLTDLATLPDGTVAASYCDWQVVHGHLRVALRRPGAPQFQVLAGVEPAKAGIDGTSSGLFVHDGKLDVAAVRLDDSSALLGAFPLDAPGPLVQRARMGPARGPTVFQRAATGTLWFLTRDPHTNAAPGPGLWLVEIPGGDVQKARRTLLEKGRQDDPWLDLALRNDGRPVAVWFSEEIKGVRMYAP